FQEAKDVPVMWFAIIAHPQQALAKLDLFKTATLLRALRFMLYMVAAELLLVPISSQTRDQGYTISYAAASYVEYLGGCLFFFGAMKLFGGKGKLQGAVITYCFLTAYLPVIWVAGIPNRPLLQAAYGKATSSSELVISM